MPRSQRNTQISSSSSTKGSRLPKALEVCLGLAIFLELLAPFFARSYGVDGPSQLNLMNQFSDLVAHGVLLPRWAPMGVFGFGISSFYFYPPVAFYIGSIIRVITGVTDSRILFQMTGLLATILCFFATRPLLRALRASKYWTNAGALIYAFAPFQIAEIYSRSSLSSHVSYIFVPLVWYGVLAVAGRTRLMRLSSILVLGVSTSLVSLSSVPLTLALMLAIAIVVILEREYLTRTILLNAALAALCATGLTAFHFAAVLTARPFAQLGDLTVKYPEYILTDLLHGVDLPAAYHIALLYGAWLFIGVIYWRYRRTLHVLEREVALIIFVIGACIALLEIPIISRPLFASVPPFTLIQGCWRFYILLLLGGVVVIATARNRAMSCATNTIAWAWVLGGIGPALLVIFNFHFFQHGNLPGTDPTEYLPIYTIHAQKVGYDTLRAHALDSTSLVNLLAGEQIHVARENPTTSRIMVTFREPHEVTFHQFYWPYWRLSVDNRNLASYSDSLGRAVAILPAGSYTAVWHLYPSTLEIAGLWLSLATAFLIIVVVAILVGRERIFRKELRE